MISNLFLSFIHDLLLVMGEDFYEKSDAQKTSVLSELKWLSSVSRDKIIEVKSFEEFLELVKESLLILNKESFFNNMDSFLLVEYFNFIKEEVVPVFDKISVKYFVATKEEKELLLSKIFDKKDLFFKNFSSFLVEASNEEVQELFVYISTKISGVGNIITIQSSRECSPTLKAEIRNEFGDEYFVIFQVNTRLLGGMLIYKNGEIVDSSWLGKINALKHIKY